MGGESRVLEASDEGSGGVERPFWRGALDSSDRERTDVPCFKKQELIVHRFMNDLEICLKSSSLALKHQIKIRHWGGGGVGGGGRKRGLIIQQIIFLKF